MNRGAIVSGCGTYRYRLWRQWGGGTRLLFVMLNPSVADANRDDPTVRKCIGFARRLGYDGIEVVNLYAYRATDPRRLAAAGFPVGGENDRHIRAALTNSVPVCAWGANARGHERARDVYEHLAGHAAVGPMALRVNKDGTPAHPLMLPYDCLPVPYVLPSP